jgi:hypothetical protein
LAASADNGRCALGELIGHRWSNHDAENVLIATEIIDIYKIVVLLISVGNRLQINLY